MNKRFSKSDHLGVPLLTNASLPNLMFIILFFFVAIATIKTSNPEVRYTIPQSATNKIDRKKLSTTIYIGKPIEYKYGSATRIQIDEVLCEREGDICRYLQQKQIGLSEEDKSNMQVTLIIDEETKMSIVNQVKQELREASVYKIIYQSRPQ